MGKVNNQGVALVFVLWVLVFLSVIAGQFCHSMKNQLDISRMIKQEVRAYYIARAGIMAALEKLFTKQIEKPLAETDWRINTELPPQPFSGGHYKVFIGNESGKVNLNYAKRELLALLFLSIGMEQEESESIVDAILDWRDADGLRRLNGAENDYYQSLETPYKCRDGFFRYKDELLLVKGITKELYFKKGLRNYISTVTLSKSKNRNKKVHNRERININAVPAALLNGLPWMTSEAAKRIVEYRKLKDIENLQDLMQLTGPDIANMLKNFIDYHYNRFYTIDAEGWIEDGAVKSEIRILVLGKITGKQRYEIVRWIDNLSTS